MKDNTIGEEDLKGLEEEIDAAVDKLFVEKSGKPSKVVSSKPLISETIPEMKKEFEWEMDAEVSLAPSPVHKTIPVKEKEVELEISPAVSVAPSPSRYLEKLDTQLLSLEWEITKESLGKTMDEILALRKNFEEVPDISTILNRMVRVLNFMIQNEERIQPHLIRFLLDSKETIKLMMRREVEDDINVYKKLAKDGIEARFLGLEEIHEVKPQPLPVQVGRDEEKTRVSLMNLEQGEKIIQQMVSFAEKLDEVVEILNQRPSIHEKMASFSTKLDEMIEKLHQPPSGYERFDTFSKKLDEIMEIINEHLSVHQRPIELPSVQPGNGKPMKMKVTVFKTGEKYFGVESHRVFKLFKVPSPLFKKMIRLGSIHLQGYEVRVIDLKKFFFVSGEDQEGEKRMLILKGDGVYKGVMMDRVLNRLSGPLEKLGELNENLLGMIRWTYQNVPVEVPILDFEKL